MYSGSLDSGSVDYAKRMARAHLKSNGLGMYAPPQPATHGSSKNGSNYKQQQQTVPSL